MWHIGEVKNEVKISKACAKSLKKWAQAEWGNDDPEIVYDDKIVFNTDHYEHMDFVDNEDVQTILMTFKAKGEICFGSLDGDNAGKFWGYRFDGKGGMVKLTGTIEWSSDDDPNAP